MAQAREQSELNNMVVNESIEMLDTRIYPEKRREEQMQQIADNNDDGFNRDADEKGNFLRPSHSPIGEASMVSITCLAYACLVKPRGKACGSGGKRVKR